jgi:hypothetical protein
MFVVDPVLLVVAACLLIVVFCLLVVAVRVAPSCADADAIIIPPLMLI